MQFSLCYLQIGQSLGAHVTHLRYSLNHSIWKICLQGLTIHTSPRVSNAFRQMQQSVTSFDLTALQYFIWMIFSTESSTLLSLFLNQFLNLEIKQKYSKVAYILKNEWRQSRNTPMTSDPNHMNTTIKATTAVSTLPPEGSVLVASVEFWFVLSVLLPLNWTKSSPKAILASKQYWFSIWLIQAKDIKYRASDGNDFSTLSWTSLHTFIFKWIGSKEKLYILYIKQLISSSQKYLLIYFPKGKEYLQKHLY